MQKYHIYNIDMKKEAKRATVIDGLSLPRAIKSSAKKRKML